MSKKVVFTNGCFDLIHPGHVEILRFAREQGDRLIVGLNSDTSVKRIKGTGRPLLPLAARRTILESIRYVDEVAVFAEETPINLIEQIRPAILVKGGDYKPDEIVGAALVLSYGGRVVLAPYYEEWSTTKLVERLIGKSLNGRFR